MTMSNGLAAPAIFAASGRRFELNSEPTKDRLDTGHPSTGGNALRAFPARCISDSEGSLNSGDLVPVSRLLAVREQKSPAVFE